MKRDEEKNIHKRGKSVIDYVMKKTRLRACTDLDHHPVMIYLKVKEGRREK